MIDFDTKQFSTSADPKCKKIVQFKNMAQNTVLKANQIVQHLEHTVQTPVITLARHYKVSKCQPHISSFYTCKYPKFNLRLSFDFCQCPLVLFMLKIVPIFHFLLPI